MTDAWTTQAVLYRHFAGTDPSLDFSETAAAAMYAYETFGTGQNPYGMFQGKMNGYAVGKRWLNWHLTEWKDAVAKGLLAKCELLTDATIPHPWIDEQIMTWPAGVHLLLQTDAQAFQTLGFNNDP